MTNKMFKCVTIAIAGCIVMEIVKEIRYRKLQKELYEAAEVIEDGQQNKE